jgi:hypothetical protein
LSRCIYAVNFIILNSMEVEMQDLTKGHSARYLSTINKIRSVALSNQAKEHDIAICALSHIVDLCEMATSSKSKENTHEIF